MMKITDIGVVLLANQIVRYNAQELWKVCVPKPRTNKRIMITVTGPKGGKYRRRETDEEYDIRYWQEEKDRRRAYKELIRWFHSSYAELLMGCTFDCVVGDVIDPDAIVNTIVRKRKQGKRMCAMELGAQRTYKPKGNKRLKGWKCST